MFKRKVAICLGCEKEKTIYARKMCEHCWKKSRQEIYKERAKLKNNYIDRDSLEEFFKKYWDEHPIKKCYECGTNLYTYKNWHLHHLIPKRKQKEYNVDITFNPDNIIYVCLECHSDADHNAMRNTPKIQMLYEILIESYKKNKTPNY